MTNEITDIQITGETDMTYLIRMPQPESQVYKIKIYNYCMTPEQVHNEFQLMKLGRGRIF